MIKIKIQNFGQFFSDTTNSYKFVYFQALLNLIKENNFQRANFSLIEIARDMLIFAWYPAYYFRLNLGPQDQLITFLDCNNIEIKPTQSMDQIRKQLKLIPDKELHKLVRYVPYRLIRPFFNELRGKSDGEINNLINKLAKKHFVSKKIFYKFVDNEKILIHSDWLEYIKENYFLVFDWLNFNYLKYLEKNNPNVPSLINKMYPPRKRNSLAKIRKIWNEVLKSNEVKCIFSNEIIKKDAFDIDHYLPWSFVTHDEPWNLMPIKASSNRSKGNKLPELDRSIDKFIKNQFLFYSYIKNHQKYKKYLLSFNIVFKIKKGDLSKKEFTKKMKEIYEPLMQIANSMGF